MADSTSLAPAIIGLVGVLVGGLIAAASNYIVATRTERAERNKLETEREVGLHRAARMVWVELQEANTALDLARGGRIWEPHDTGAHTRSDNWEKYGEILAASMPFNDWDNVSRSYASVHTLRSWYNRDSSVVLTEDAIPNFNVAMGNIEQAILSLEPYLGRNAEPRNS